MAIFELMVVEPTTGFPAYPLPDAKNIQLSPVFASIGAVSFSYPVSGVNASMLKLSIPEKDVEIAVMRDGVEVDDLRFIINTYEGDEANSAEEGQMWTYNGRTNLSLLERAIVYPPGYPTPPVLDTVQYTNSTAGKIMGTLITTAQARGALSGIIIGSFSQTTDSNGATWTKQITIEYRAGLKYSDVLSNLVDQGMVECRMIGRELKLYNPDTMSVDRTLGTSPVIFRKGRDLSDAPRKVSRDDIASVFLAGGSEGIYSEAVNAGAVATFGRWESFDSQGGVSDPGTLAAYSQYQRDLRAAVTMEKSHGLVFGGGCPEPVADFNIGDWAWSDTNGTKERLRIKQWAISIAESGNVSGIVVLGDLFSELQDKIVKRVNGILGGTTLTGESRATDTTEIIDTVPPSKPLAMVLSSLSYVTPTGTTLAQISATWTAPTTNTDGSPLTDLAGYNVFYRYDNAAYGNGWQGGLFTETNSLSMSPFATNSVVHVRAQAVDRSGNLSAWSDDVSITTAGDTTAPPVPSTPTVENYLSSLRVTWNGLGSVGQQMPADFKYVEVHISSVTGFTPSGATLVDVLTQGGVSVLVPVSTPKYNTDNFVKLIAVDTSGNKSAASSQGTGQAKQVVSTDIAGNVIDFSNIKFKDLGNLIPDGSFELPETAAEYASIAYYEVATGPTGVESPKALRMDPPGAGVTVDQYLVRDVPCKPGQQYVLIRSELNEIDINVSARLGMWIKRYYANGTNDTFEIEFYSQLSNDNLWNYRDATYTTIPANCYKFDIFLRLSDFSVGRMWLDDMELRPVIETALIQDAAITNAKIGLLAVQDANVANMNVGKLTAGTLGADVVVGARIKTANTGARVELNTGGFGAWDAGNVQTVAVTTAGAMTATGTFSSGTIGSNQVRMSASGPWTDPAVWFVQPSNSWAFSPTLYSPVSDGSLRMISAEVTANSSGRSQLVLSKDHWDLTTQFVPTPVGDGTSQISSAGKIYINSGNAKAVEIRAGGTAYADMGLIDLKGKLPTLLVGNAMIANGSGSGAFSTGASGQAFDITFTWGPTLAGGTPRALCSIQRASGYGVARIQTMSSTTALCTATSLAAGSTAATITILGWQV